jgi:hypothetical protein
VLRPTFAGIVTLALGASLGLAPAATAALPMAGARYAAHNHVRGAAGWSVELQVSRRHRDVLHEVVLYDGRCNELIRAEQLPLTAEGAVDAGGAFTPDGADPGDPPGSWQLDGRFVSEHMFDGSLRIAEPACDSTREFQAWHSGHRHFTQLGYADVDAATPAARAQARRMLRRVRSVAARRFPTIQRAREQGFSRYMVKIKNPAPGVFHLWSRRYNRDDTILDPERPESLVYWEPVDRAADPVLLAFMFRARPGPPPPFAGSIPVWHNHERGGDKMFHVWLTPGLRAGFANCLPVPELERELHPFTFDDVPAKLHEAQPCPQRGA